MRLPILFLAATLCNTIISAQVRQVKYQGFLEPTNTMPTFDKGYVLAYDYHGEIDVYAPDGSPLCRVSAHVPNAKIANIQNAAADTDGTVVSAVHYSLDGTSRTMGGGIALFDRTGKQIVFFDTGRYRPTQVCFAPDHSVWTLGWRGRETSRETDDYFILRNYSQDGQEIGAFLPRSSFEPGQDPVGPNVGGWQLRIINDRIGAVFYGSSILKPLEQPRPMQWIEVDLKGEVLGRWELGAELSPWAFTGSGALYTQGHGAVWVFDRSRKAWRRVTDAPSGYLLGADGDSLVFEDRDKSRLSWVRASQ